MLKSRFILIIIICAASLTFDLTVFNAHHRTPPAGAEFKDIFRFHYYSGDGCFFNAHALRWMDLLGVMRFKSQDYGLEFSQYFKTPSYRVAPGYPFLIGITYKIFGLGNYRALILGQMILKSLTALLIFMIFTLIGAKFGFYLTDISGLVSAILYATWLPASIYVHYYPFYSETMAVFFIVLTTYLVLSAIANKNHWRWLCAGLSCGIVVLTRESWLLFPFFLLLGMLFYNYTFKKISYIRFMIFILAAVLSVAPLTIYNFHKYGKFIPVASSAFGWSQWADYGKSRYGVGFNAASLAKKEETDTIQKIGESAYNVDYQRQLLFKAMSLYAAHPVAFLRGQLQYYHRLWIYGSPPPLDLPVVSRKFGNSSCIPASVAILLSLPFLILATAGIACCWKKWQIYPLLFSPLLYVLIVNMFFHFEFRYSLPAWPFIFLACGFAWNKLLRKLWSRISHQAKNNNTACDNF